MNKTTAVLKPNQRESVVLLCVNNADEKRHDKINETPNLGLVCITHSLEVRYRTITLTRYRNLPEEERRPVLEELYRSNLETLFKALGFCKAQGIRLYRMTANLFPLGDLDDGVGREVLSDLSPRLAEFAPAAETAGVRVVIHPEQFVVLNSLRPEVVVNSVRILKFHGMVLDLLGLPQSSWCAVNIHGGKGGRPDELVETIATLPDTVRTRLTLENDERAYGAAEILEVCKAAGVPMVFDAHHHVVKEKLSDFDDASVAEFTRRARQTWTPPEWQVVHLSNGREGVQDKRHSDLVSEVPTSYAQVSWIEVEAKHKEVAIAGLRGHASLAGNNELVAKQGIYSERSL